MLLLGEGAIEKGYKFVGYRDGDRLYVELQEAYDSCWVVDTIEVKDMKEMAEYIDICQASPNPA